MSEPVIVTSPTLPGSRPTFLAMSAPEQPMTAAGEADPPQRRPWRWILALTIAVVALATTGLALNLFTDVPLTISQETTYITEPLTPDGQWVDYFAAVEQRRYPAEMQTDDNGARLIVRALGPFQDPSLDVVAQAYGKLGLNPASPPLLTFEEPYLALARYVDEQEALGALPPGVNPTRLVGDLNARLHRPWTIEELPMMRHWLVKHEPALDLIGEATRRPTFCIPYVRISDLAPALSLNNEQYHVVRSYVRGFSARALHRIGLGDLDGAIDDFVTIARLGRCLQSKGTIYEVISGLSAVTVASSIGIAEALDHPPTTEQIRRLMEEWNSLPPAETLDNLLKTQRYVLLDRLQALAQGDWSNEDHRMPAVGPFTGVSNEQYGFDWNIVLRRANSNFEDLLHNRPLPPSPTGWQTLGRAPRSVLLADVIVEEEFSATKVMRGAISQSECRVRMLRITLAMLLYEREHGTLPPTYTVDANGNRLHSWRVLLLPHLGAEELYSQIRLDEPWDSPHNSQFHAAADHFFQCPSHPLAQGETSYAVVEGAGAPFDGPVGRALVDLGPDRVNMLLVVERTTAANWMDPHHEVPLANALLGINVIGMTGIGLGSDHTAGMHAGLVSGGVELVTEKIDLATELPARLASPVP
jgi:hypothetical protein